tara:strand:+ start:941 stop:1075 length:135 start_codon:yes stop_codon:yes gene_type:complete
MTLDRRRFMTGKPIRSPLLFTLSPSSQRRTDVMRPPGQSQIALF